MTGNIRFVFTEFKELPENGYFRLANMYNAYQTLCTVHLDFLLVELNTAL